MNDKHYLYKIINNNIILKNKFPCIIDLKWNFLKISENHKKIYISGIPPKAEINKTNYKNTIPNQFIISKIYMESANNVSKIIIYGKLIEELPNKNYIININLLFPKCILKCNLQAYSHYVESNIY